MAVPGKILTHPFTGEKIEFLETHASTGGELLKMRISTPPGVGPPFLHYHLHQQEEFYIEKGQIEFVVGTRKIQFKDNGYIKIPIEENHTYKTTGNDVVVKIVELRPARNFEFFVENLIGLAQDGKTNKKGVPNPIQMMLLQYESEIYIAKIPRIIQNLLWGIAKLIGKLSGMKPYYDKYQN